MFMNKNECPMSISGIENKCARDGKGIGMSISRRNKMKNIYPGKDVWLLY